MIARILTLMLVATLAMPVATLTRPADTSQAPWSEISVAAKGKKHKGKKQKKANEPQSKTVTHTTRQSVTQTFASTEPITIPGAPGETNGEASPYPAAITVSGFSNGTITDVNLILNDFTNSYVSDVDVLLSRDDGRRALVISDVAEGYSATDVDLTLDDEAAAPLTRMAISSGAFRPTDFNVGMDTFNAPAPAPNGNVALSTFDGADPNGTWRLWVMEASPTDDSDFGGGWALQITAEADITTVDEQAPSGQEAQKGSKDKKKGKKGKK